MMSLSEEGKGRNRKSKTSRKKQQKRKTINIMEENSAVSFTSLPSPAQLLLFLPSVLRSPVDLLQHF